MALRSGHRRERDQSPAAAVTFNRGLLSVVRGKHVPALADALALAVDIAETQETAVSEAFDDVNQPRDSILGAQLL